MRRAILTLLVSVCAVVSAGCLAMSTNTRMGSQYDAVVVDDRVLIVNKCTGQVREVDLSCVEPLEPTTAPAQAAAE